MKRNAKSWGSGGRMRLALLLGTAAAFLLVPAASAFAKTAAVEVVFAGSGSGLVEGEAGKEGGEPHLKCHWNGTAIDEGTPEPGKCKTTAVEVEPGLVGIVVIAKEDPGSEFAGWAIEEEKGVPLCEEGNPKEKSCGVLSFGTPIKIKATFNAKPHAPENITLPTITGTAKEGKTLHGNAGTWKYEPTSYTYQWLRCDAAGEACSPIAGAVATEYTATAADVGSTIRFEETATNAVGSASAQSAATAIVVGAAAGSEEDIKEGEVYGEVPQTTSLASACGEVFLGEFKPGVTANYHNTCMVTATSTGAATSLSAADETGVDVGHLTQKPTHPYSLAQLLQVKATDTESLGGTSTGSQTLASPSTLLSYSAPVSADNVEVEFNQPIGLHDPLHTGVYAKTITLTLKQTTP